MSLGTHRLIQAAKADAAAGSKTRVAASTPPRRMEEGAGGIDGSHACHCQLFRNRIWDKNYREFEAKTFLLRTDHETPSAGFILKLLLKKAMYVLKVPPFLTVALETNSARPLIQLCNICRCLMVLLSRDATLSCEVFTLLNSLLHNMADGDYMICYLAAWTSNRSREYFVTI